MRVNPPNHCPGTLILWLVLGSPLASLEEPQTLFPVQEPIYSTRVTPAFSSVIGPRQKHTYTLRLDNHKDALVYVRQFGVDIRLVAADLNGHQTSVSSPTYRQGPEYLFLEAGTPFRTVSIFGPAEGSVEGFYEITLLDISDWHPDKKAAFIAASEAGAVEISSPQQRSSAIALYKRAADLFHVATNTEGSAWICLSLAILLYQEGDLFSAIPYYDNAWKLLENIGDFAGAAISLNDLGSIYSQIGRGEDAQTALQSALSILAKEPDPYISLAIRNNLCLVVHRSGDRPSALPCYQDIAEEEILKREPSFAAVLYTNLGSLYDTLGDPDQAIKNLFKALQLRRSLRDDVGTMRILNNLGVVYRRLGETSRALDSYTLALHIADTTDNSAWKARILSNNAMALYSLGEYHQASLLLNQSLGLRRDVGDRPGEVTTLNNLGRNELALGNVDDAIQYHEDALKLSQALNNDYLTGTTMILIAEAEMKATNYQQASKFLSKSQSFIAESRSPRHIAEIQHLLGVLAIRGHQHEQARRYLMRALEVRQQIHDITGALDTLVAMAELEIEVGDAQVAYSVLTDALRLSESSAGRIVDPDQKASFLATTDRAIELTTSILMEGSLKGFASPVDAYSTAFFLNATRRARTYDRQVMAPFIENGEGRLRYRHDDRLRRLLRGREIALTDASASDGDVAFLKNEIRDLEHQLQTSDYSPSGARLAWLDGRRSVTKLQEKIADDAVILEFAVGADSSYLWAITRSSFSWYALPGRDFLREKAIGVYETLRKREFPPKENHSPYQLSCILLGSPLENIIAHRLYIIPDEFLHLIPFGSLPLPFGCNSSPGEKPDGRVVERYEVAYVPAVHLLPESAFRSSVASSFSTIAIFADPIFNREDSRLPPQKSPSSQSRSISSRTEDRRLARLRSSREEALSIQSLFEPEAVLLALDHEASKPALLEALVDGWDIVHISTHGSTDLRRPEATTLVLSRFGQGGNAIDGIVNIEDIYTVDIKRKLVVLSGCETNLGREVGSEGLIGLPRAFLSAGADKVVASLWKADDSATAQLMKSFYRFLILDHLSPNAALRRAQMEILGRREWSDPFYWGGFVINESAPIGHGRSSEEWDN